MQHTERNLRRVKKLRTIAPVENLQRNALRDAGNSRADGW
jgi:hypothetical protein